MQLQFLRAAIIVWKRVRYSLLQEEQVKKQGKERVERTYSVVFIVKSGILADWEDFFRLECCIFSDIS